jgi:D-serine deaminase-like pyridoxal phosphate-dependent protein
MSFLKKSDLDTPFIAADISRVKANIQRMQKLADEHGKKLRPHAKTHKLPVVALWQIEAGAVGICVQKTDEAEVMVKHGVKDVFVSNEVIGIQKTDRLAHLASMSKISVAVDSELGIKQLSQSAKSQSAEIGVYVDVDVGMHRCGVAPEKAGILADMVAKSPNLSFRGVMGYDGHSFKPLDRDERKKIVRESHRLVQNAVAEIKAKGLAVEAVTVGGTPSTPIWAELDGVTELQPGAYVYNDAMQVERGTPKSDCAVTLMATVMSKPSSDRAVIDAGSKSFAFDCGKYPVPVNSGYGEVVGFSEEHAVLRSENDNLKAELGQKLEFIPYHICTFIDLWDKIHFCRDDDIISTVDIDARGART